MQDTEPGLSMFLHQSQNACCTRPCSVGLRPTVLSCHNLTLLPYVPLVKWRILRLHECCLNREDHLSNLAPHYIRRNGLEKVIIGSWSFLFCSLFKLSPPLIRIVLNGCAWSSKRENGPEIDWHFACCNFGEKFGRGISRQGKCDYVQQAVSNCSSWCCCCHKRGLIFPPFFQSLNAMNNLVCSLSSIIVSYWFCNCAWCTMSFGLQTFSARICGWQDHEIETHLARRSSFAGGFFESWKTVLF